jgi:hypothetical protein
MVEIFDCRRKEKLSTRRVGGDFEVRITNLENGRIDAYWFQLKKPAKSSAERVEILFASIKKELERQEE